MTHIFPLVPIIPFPKSRVVSHQLCLLLCKPHAYYSQSTINIHKPSTSAQFSHSNISTDHYPLVMTNITGKSPFLPGKPTNVYWAIVYSKLLVITTGYLSNIHELSPHPFGRYPRYPRSLRESQIIV